MNYGYENKEDKEIIKNYNKENDILIINYLDGSQQEILLTDENEKKLLSEMLEQAKERNNSSTIEKTERSRNRFLFQEILCLLFASSNMLRAVRCSISNEKFLALVYPLLAGACGVLAVINDVEYKLYNEKLDEFKKYAVYIDLLNKLEKLNENEKNNLLKIENNYININTLDNFSLKEIKKLRNHIENNSMHVDMMAAKNETLGKRIK